MTRFEWLVLRKKQGHHIFICECGHAEPEYNVWWHEFKTGHTMKVDNNGSQSQQTSST